MLTIITAAQVCLEFLNEKFSLNNKLLLPIINSYDESKPYIIGLTGGLASGKSTVINELKKFGISTVDCDKLGHEAYEKDTNAYNKIINAFGIDILDENKSINRKILGQKVFTNKNELKKLCDIVWPEIKDLLNKKIYQEFRENGKKIIFVEAALLIEADWYKLMNEIWVCVVPVEEAIKRAIQRDKSDVTKVKLQMKNQLSNEERARYAHVIIDTSGEKELTVKQINNAIHHLNRRLNNLIKK